MNKFMQIISKQVVNLSAIAAVMVGVSLSQVSAAQYYDTDDFTLGSTQSGQFIAGGGFYTDLLGFNITSSNAEGDGDQVGYNPGSQYLITATATFQLAGSGNVSSQVKVTLGSDELTLLSNFGTVLTYVFGEAAGFSILNNNGIISYTVNNTGNSDFYLNSADLTVEAGDKLPGTSVPDAGNTVVFLGVTMMGLLALRRRISVA